LSLSNAFRHLAVSTGRYFRTLLSATR